MTATSRREAIADAAITTLAREGSRGLTHRAVDRQAGLAQGSTSYYFRTRDALVMAAVERLAELDARLVPAAPSGPGDGFADAVAGLEEAIRAALGPGRDRLLARYALALEATWRPELRPALDRGEQALRTRFAALTERLGAPDPLAAARDVLVLLDGVLFAAVTRGLSDDGSDPDISGLAGMVLAGVGARGPHTG